MQEKELKLLIGSLLHDVGKLLYRYNDGRNHSQSGYEFLRDEIKIEDRDILNQVHFHHGSYLKNASILQNSLAYITYIADNIASGADRRKFEEVEEKGFVKEMQLDSIFNLLNGNSDNKKYLAKVLEPNGEINFPSETSENFNSEVYSKIINNIKDSLKGISLTESYANSLLEILEANLSFVPSSTSKEEVADISLFDHVKLTAAISSCILKFLQEKGEEDYKSALFKNAEKFYTEDAFLIYSMDISGIQKFIYTIDSEGALKNLRARSFYLEIMLEHIIDELLTELQMSRANLLYSGGGHCYLILANTQKTKEIIDEFNNELRNWFLKTFDTALYAAYSYTEASGDDLNYKNSENSKADDSKYKKIFERLSEKISKMKLQRYSAEEIILLNNSTKGGEERECKICGRVDRLTAEDKCEICIGIESLSEDIMSDNKNYATILSKQTIFTQQGNSTSKQFEKAVLLPFDKYLQMSTEQQLLDSIKEEDGYIRAYCLNRPSSGEGIATNLWVANYRDKVNSTFSKMAKNAKGVDRIAVLRADIDNLGTAFVSGFEREDKNKYQYVGISRTATFSRKLSLFFKLHVNRILQDGNGGAGYKVAVVYSGGDDMFIVGAWDEVIEAGLHIEREFSRFSQETLTISAGIGVFGSSYPVYSMAETVGDLEELSKENEIGDKNKNSITLFEKGHTYGWSEFRQGVWDEKLKYIESYLSKINADSEDEKGNAMLYKLLELIRATNENPEEKINIARFAYFLARLEPGNNDSEEMQIEFADFRKKLYYWIRDKREREKLITAIYLYVYLHRENNEEVR
ncbi:MAG: type III-A CRISPR-associated protein Cas10/Csm1 [Anaerovoracaceae bacterium]